MGYALLFAVFIIATCGLIYELICSTIASYLLGDSITQFSTIIGVYLFAMGIGSFLSKYIRKNLILFFIQTELLIGLIGGCSAALLFTSFEYIPSFRIILYALVSLIGILVGLEIPLLMRILKDNFEFSDLVSKIFTFDYIGALLASLLFPMVLVPHLGLIRSAFLFGFLNICVALWTIQLFKKELPIFKHLQAMALVLLIGLVFGLIYAERIMSFAENNSYPDKIIYSKSSAYQRIVLTNNEHADLRLFLNGNLQFSSHDEYRYHEALVHIGLASLSNPRKVLVLGGGDGLAVREILKYSSIEKIVLVDLDQEITKLFSKQKFLCQLNNNSLHSQKLKMISADAFSWLRINREKFDFIVIDFPDPNNYSLGKLYTDTFYRIVQTALNEDGAMVIQSTSPYYAKKSFWCVVNTLESVGLETIPYHAYIPSFGEWGYILASPKSLKLKAEYPVNLKFINPQTLASLLYFPKDMQIKSNCLNKLNNQALVGLFEDEWSEYTQIH